ncbi:MAG: hypothetical protein GX297_04085 [Treponema sp.]|jgi:hypothetical protein|nr:hypothetical protein [Treponema sp.]
MDIILDGVILDITIEDEKNIGDILRALERELELNSATMVEISADNTVIPADKLDNLFETPIEQVQTLEVKSVTAKEVADVLKHLFEAFESLAEKLENIPVQLQKNEDKIAMNTVTELADALSLLFQTIPYVNLFPETFDNLTIESKRPTSFISDFPSLLEDFRKAVESNDTVLIGDIAEYEIAPRLRQLSELQKSL